MAGDTSIAAQIRARFQQLRQQKGGDANDGPSRPLDIETPTPPAGAAGGEGVGSERENESTSKIAQVVPAKSTTLLAKPPWQAEMERKAAIEDWQTHVLGPNVAALKRYEPDRDKALAEVTAFVQDSGEHGGAPAVWLNMTPSEWEGSIAQAFNVIWPTALNGKKGLIKASDQPLEKFKERMGIDALEAHALMVADQRGYSLAGLIKEGCTMVLTGLMGAGKSTLAMNLARAWALGESFLGRETKQSKTFVVVSPKEYEAWAETVGFWQIGQAIFLAESTKAHFKDTAEQVRWFAFQMEHFGCRTFVLDTLFDFFGMPANNSGDQNRIVMNEQAPLLQMVRERMFSGLVLGHPPKSEAQALTPRDPEESFGGHTAWAAQHRMRGTLRRNSGANAFITGRGGYGDQGILAEEMLLFDEQTRLVSLGGPFKNFLGVVAMPVVKEALSGWTTRSDLEKKVGKRKEWILAGLKEGLKRGEIKTNGKQGRMVRYALADEPEQNELF